MASVGDNIRRLRKSYDMTQEDLGKIADVSSMAVSQWENGRAVPRMGAVQRLADHFGVSKGEIIDDTALSPLPPNAITPTVVEAAYAPLRGRVHAGKPCDPEVLEEELVALPVTIFDSHPQAFFLAVEGDCMDKVYPEGCLILVDPDKEPQSGSIAALSINGEECVMRRMLRTTSTMVLAPESFNAKHKDIVITAESGDTVELIGTVVWFQSNGEME